MTLKFRHIALMMAAAWMVAACGGGGDDIATPVTPAPTPSPVTPTPTPSTPTAIAFMGSIPEEQRENHGATRAEEEGLETYYKQFKVWAFKHLDSATENVMDGYTVRWVENSAGTALSNTHGWEYVNQQSLGETEQSIKYWDFNATDYRFFGIAGSTATNGHYEPDATSPTKYVVTYTADARYPEGIPLYSHLWYSNSYTDFGQPVKLEFIRPVSKVRFMFTFENPDDAPNTELTDKDFRPTSGTTIKQKGDVTVTYMLQGSDITENFAATSEAEGMTAMTRDYYASVTKNDEENPTVITAPYRMALGDEKLNQEYTVLPVTGQGSYTLTVSVNGDPKTTVVSAEYMDWKPGYEYTYIFKIHVDGGVSISSVQAAFTPWTFHEKPRTVYNW